MRGISHFSVYRNLSAEPKRADEADVLSPFLLSLEEFITLDDVEYGQDPPDFIFRHSGSRIGVELTVVLPKVFESGGYARKAVFKPWKAATKDTPQPRHEFEWGEFTLRESLGAFADQFASKCQKAKAWDGIFSAKWLLMHVGSGSPFGGLVATRGEDARGRSAEVQEYFARMAHEISTICKKPSPFHYVIFFSGLRLLTFPTGEANPYRLPNPRADVLARGAAADDRFLDWRSTVRSIIEHPYLKPESRQQTEPKPNCPTRETPPSI